MEQETNKPSEVLVEVTIPEREIVDINSLKSDGKNPNRMSKEDHERLRSSMIKYGWIYPIITNKDLVIADGEQRWQVGKELGLKTVPIYRLTVKDVDRRIMRQLFNKLKGEHDLLADSAEFRYIKEQGGEDELKYFLNLSAQEFQRYLNDPTKVTKALDTPPNFKDIDKIPTSHKCPQCGYSW